MKRILLILTIMLPAVVSAQKLWTLQECVEQGVSHNVSLKRADVEAQVQQHQAEASRKAWLPRVQADVTGTLNFDMNMDLLARQNFVYAPFAVTAEMPLDISGQIRNQSRADALELKALLADREKAENDLSLGICAAYLQAVYARSIHQIAAEEVKMAQERVDMVRSLVEEGVRSEGEMSEANSSLAEAEHASLQSANQWEKARLELAQLLLIEDYESFDLAELSDAADAAQAFGGLMNLQSAIDYAQANNAAVRSAQLRQEASDYDVKVAKSELYPKLTLRGQIGAFAYRALKSEESYEEYKDVWKNRNEMISLNLSIPVFNGFATRSRIKQAELRSVDSRLAADEEWSRLKHEIEQAYQSAVASQKEYASAQHKAEQYTAAYAYQRDRYEDGLGTWLELREADSRLQQALYGVQQARFQYIMNQKILNFYKGEPIR